MNYTESEFARKVKDLRGSDNQRLTDKGLWLAWIYARDNGLKLTQELAIKINQFNKSEIGNNNAKDYIWLEKISYSSDYIGILK